MRTILVVGGGYAGFYTAWKLEKKLRRDEARVVVVDPRPYMTYQPFLPEVLAGSIESRYAAAVVAGDMIGVFFLAVLDRNLHVVEAGVGEFLQRRAGDSDGRT